MRSSYRKFTTREWAKVLLYVLLAFAVIFAVSLLIPPPASPVIVGALIFMALYYLVRWDARNMAYRCPHCKHEFHLSGWADFFGPNGINRKYVKCPECRRWGWAGILKKE